MSSIGEILTLRSEFEEIVGKNYIMPKERKAGTVDNLVYFTKNAFQCNRSRRGYQRAMKIAKTIIEDHNAGTNRGFRL